MRSIGSRKYLSSTVTRCRFFASATGLGAAMISEICLSLTEPGSAACWLAGAGYSDRVRVSGILKRAKVYGTGTRSVSSSVRSISRHSCEASGPLRFRGPPCRAG